MSDVHSIPPMPEGQVRANTGSKFVPSMQTMYFFKRKDATYFSVGEHEAWSILSGRLQRVGPIIALPEYVGRSKGELYYNAHMDVSRILAESGPEAAHKSLEEAIAAEYALAAQDQGMPRNFETVDSSGNPINLSSFGV